jgi:hypothetical protein
VDVLGDGNCLYYCLLQYLVERGQFAEVWKERVHPAFWMREKIRKWVGRLSDEEWMVTTSQNEPEFVASELYRIYDSSIDYLDVDAMRESDAYFGSAIDCLGFSERYEMAVIIYFCDENPKACSTAIFDSRKLDPDAPPNHLESHGPERLPPNLILPRWPQIRMLPGIVPNVIEPGPQLLELVRYFADGEKSTEEETIDVLTVY